MNQVPSQWQCLLWFRQDTSSLGGSGKCRRKSDISHELVEEDHHFCKEGEKYYRRSKIYRNVIDKASGKVIDKEFIHDNRSEVMYDYSLIPKELIRE